MVIILGVCAKALSVFLEVPSIQWITLANIKFGEWRSVGTGEFKFMFGELALSLYWQIQVNINLNSPIQTENQFTKLNARQFW